MWPSKHGLLSIGGCTVRILVEADAGAARRDEVAAAVHEVRDVLAQAVVAVLVAAPPTEERAGPDSEPAPAAEEWDFVEMEPLGAAGADDATPQDEVPAEVLLARRVAAARRLGVQMRSHLEQGMRPPKQQPWPVPLRARC